MVKFNSLLHLRLKAKDPAKQKMTALAERSSNGELSSFSGVFRISSLSEKEKSILSEILTQYKTDQNYNIDEDLSSLLSLSSEVKAITNQAVILHGERVKKAQEILKKYKDGAFTAWLIATYGNRQTPYNFLQYYEFYTSMPSHLHKKIDAMPRQAVYTLASRTGLPQKKEEIVQNYEGEPKQVLLTLIRKTFPLDRDDKRLPNIASQSISSLVRLKDLFEHDFFAPTEKQKETLSELLNFLKAQLEKSS